MKFQQENETKLGRYFTFLRAASWDLGEFERIHYFETALSQDYTSPFLIPL